MRFRDVEHLFRLSAVFAGGLLLFVVVRAELVPEDFGRLGHYRAGAVDEIRSRPVGYAGQKACAECHTDVVETRALSRHRALSCESCHGPLASHAAGEGPKPTRPEATPLCVRCHAARTGKPVRYPRVEVKDHAGDAACITCHQPHNPGIQ
jgi:predicted CXXCH cytochrome family protein